MKEFAGKVAVVTGAGSGIGRGFAHKCAQEKMKVVIADINPDTLKATADQLTEQGATVLAVTTDVSDASSVEALAQKTKDEFGAVHVLFNNAGVAGKGIIEGTLDDHKWLLGINLWGVIHGIHYFLPIMQAQDTEAHIINTASVAGITSYEGGMYTVSKHAVVALSETLHHDLTEAQSKVSVSVLCPGAVDTGIVTNQNNVRKLSGVKESPIDETDPGYIWITEALKAGLSPAQVADIIFAGIRDNTFCILTDPNWKPVARSRVDALMNGNPPTPAVVNYMRIMGAE